MTTILWLCLTIAMVVAAATVEAQQPTKMRRIGWLSGSSLSAISIRSEASGKVCVSLGTSRIKTSSLNGDMERENRIA